MAGFECFSVSRWEGSLLRVILLAGRSVLPLLSLTRVVPVLAWDDRLIGYLLSSLAHILITSIFTPIGLERFRKNRRICPLRRGFTSGHIRGVCQSSGITLLVLFNLIRISTLQHNRIHVSLGR